MKSRGLSLLIPAAICLTAFASATDTTLTDSQRLTNRFYTTTSQIDLTIPITNLATITSTVSRPTIPVILDTDIGTDIDDTWALALLLRCPELDPKLILMETGDSTYRAKITAKLLAKAGRTAIPIGLGVNSRSKPLSIAN